VGRLPENGGKPMLVSITMFFVMALLVLMVVMEARK
jgi:predicted nucleic acid-binding Zn ribbon protein